MNRFTTPPSTLAQPSDEWRVEVAKVTRGMLDILVREVEDVNLDELRRRVIWAARVALGDEPSRGENGITRPALAACYRQERYGLPLGPDALPGMLRIVIDFKRPDWRGWFTPETIMAEVQRVLDEELGCPHLSPWQRASIRESAREIALTVWNNAAREARELGVPDRRGDRASLLAEVMDHARKAMTDTPGDPTFGIALGIVELQARAALNAFLLKVTEQDG